MNSGSYEAEINRIGRLITEKAGEIDGIISILSNSDFDFSSPNSTISLNLPQDLPLTRLDKEWWMANKDLLLANGWKFENNKFIYATDKGDFVYDPNSSNLKTPTGDTSKCDILVYGDPSQITEVFTALKSDLGKDSPNNSNTPRLVLVEQKEATEYDKIFQGKKDSRCNHIFEMSDFGDILLGSLGNNKPKTHTIGGFSYGGIAAMELVRRHPGYYDKLVLFNITPGNNNFLNEMYSMDPSPYKDLDVEIVVNYKNIIKDGSKDDRNDDFFKEGTMKGPHFDKMVAAGANVTLIVPDISKAPKGSHIEEMVDYAKELGIPVKQFEITEDLEYITTVDGQRSHGVGCNYIMPAYFEGFNFI